MIFSKHGNYLCSDIFSNSLTIHSEYTLEIEQTVINVPIKFNASILNVPITDKNTVTIFSSPLAEIKNYEP